MNDLKNINLIKVLNIFKKCREELFQDFINENIELFEAMFKYENCDELMQLAIEQYIIKFINCHFKYKEKYKNDITIEFNKAMLNFIEKFNITISNLKSNNSSELFNDLIQDKLRILKEMIQIGERSNRNFNKLSYSYEREKTLFRREINNKFKKEI